jgi:DNA-binding MarR family transcriptional regulator
MIAGGSLERDAALIRLATLAGCSAVMMNDDRAADFILVDLSSETEGLANTITRIKHYVERHSSTALIWTKLAALEDVSGILPQGQCHFLVDADDIEAVPILAGVFGRGRMDQLHDRNREIEFGSLHRISDELAEFARALARIAEIDREKGVSDKPVSFRAAPLGGFQGFPQKNSATNAAPTQNLREIIKLRRLRDRFFQNDLFADPAWDILLDLKAAALEGQRVSVSSLCIAAAVPPTTALRWITAMTENGMLVRSQDPADARRVFIVLSDETSAKLDDYFVAVGARSASVI